MPGLNAGQPLTVGQQGIMDALAAKEQQVDPAQGALATKSSNIPDAKSSIEPAPDPVDKATNLIKGGAAADHRRSAEEIGAAWMADVRLYQPPMVNQHPLDWVQSQLPKLLTALSRR